MQYYIQQENGLLKDCRLTMSNPFVRPISQPAKNIVLQNLDDLAKDYNRITSNAQYQYKSGRYVLQTKNVLSYTNLAQLFDMDNWIKRVFYARMSYWYSARVKYNAISTAFGELPLMAPQSSLTSISSASGVTLAPSQNISEIYTLLSPELTDRVVADNFVINFVVKFASGYEIASAAPFITVVDTVFDTLTIGLVHDNCLKIGYNNTHYIVRLLDPTQMNVVTIGVQHAKSLLPRILIFINGVCHADELLSDNQKMPGIGGSAVVLYNNTTVSASVLEIVACELPSSESVIDYAFFKTLSEATRMSDFFGATKIKSSFRLVPEEQVFQLNPTTLFSCSSGFSFNSLLGRVQLVPGSLWVSSMNFFEIYTKVSFDVVPRLASETPLTSQTIVFDLGPLELSLHTPALVLTAAYNQQEYGSVQLTNNQSATLSVEVKKKSRDAPRGMDGPRIVVCLNDTIVASISTALLTQEMTNSKATFRNTSNQVIVDLVGVRLDLVRSQEL